MNPPTNISTLKSTADKDAAVLSGLKAPGEGDITKPISSANPELYTLIYMRNGDRQTNFKNFKHSGNLQSAIAKAQDYCREMGFRHLRVETFICDLDKELAYRRGQDTA